MNYKQAAYREGGVSIWGNLILSALKFRVAVVSGSVALMADAWHTMSDSLSSLVVIAAARLAVGKPDSRHPFGHGRWEQIASLWVGFLLVILAYDFMRDAVVRFANHEAASFGLWAIIVTVVSVIVKELMARYAFSLWRKTGNTVLRADGWHHRADALSSLLVLAGILFSQKVWWMDSVLGVLMSVMLGYAAYQIVRDSIDKLLGETPSEEMVQRIQAVICSVAPDCDPHHLHIHNYVTHRELTLHIRLDGGMNIRDAHQIATQMEKKIEDELQMIATIHVEPNTMDSK